MKAASPELVATFQCNPSSKSLDFIRTSSNVFFSSCKWSADGTTIVAADSDSTISTLILPPTLLESNEPQTLETYAQQKLPGPCHSLEIYPQYSLAEPSSALFLASPASLPIRLLSPFSPDIIASYPIINATTEEYLAPHSLLFDPRDSSQFFAGTDSLICVFDVNRNGQEPVTEIKTIPSRRKKIVGGGVGMKGIVSTMSMNSDGLLATGTFTRWIGLYDGGRQSDSAAYFQLGRNQGDEGSIGKGAGVSQLLWTNDGRYLIVNERGSTGLGVWDIRGTGQRLCWLNGRDATTMQRTQVTLQDGTLWAGCDDGSVRIWNDIGKGSDSVEPDQSLTLGKDTISSALLHPGGSVLATCEGTRQYRDTLEEHIEKSGGVKNADGKTSSDTVADSYKDAHGRINIWSLGTSWYR